MVDGGVPTAGFPGGCLDYRLMLVKEVLSSTRSLDDKGVYRRDNPKISRNHVYFTTQCFMCYTEHNLQVTKYIVLSVKDRKHKLWVYIKGTTFQQDKKLFNNNCK